MSTDLLSFHHVEFGYDRKTKPLFSDLDFSLKAGGVTVILGPNGAGKSTLLLLAMGWLPSWRGEIRFSGKPIRSFNRRTLSRELAFIPQSEHIPFELTVLEYVLLGRTPYLPPLGIPSREDINKAYSALEKIGIAHLYDRSALSLSGGERQMVILARAMAQESGILLMDEPSSHLDLANKYRLMRIIHELQKNGCTILLTSHEPDFALAVGENAILMKNGNILFSGSMQEAATDHIFSSLYGILIKIRSVDGKKQVIWN